MSLELTGVRYNDTIFLFDLKVKPIIDRNPSLNEVLIEEMAESLYIQLRLRPWYYPFITI